MTEFDFDELDRAVNNLMTDVDTSKRSEAFDDPEEKTVELTDTTDQPSAGSVPPSVTQPLAVQRRGRFMDVVHPSSDMSAPFPPRREGMMAAAASPARSGYGTNPSSTEPVVSPDEAPDSESSPSDANEPVGFQVPQESVAAETFEEPIEQPSETDHPEDAPSTDSQESSEPEKDDDNGPMESPFLADAKVEKRPLGMPAEESEGEGNTYAPEPGESQAESSQPVEEAPVSEPTPKELTPEIMSIESNSIYQPTPEQDVPDSAPADPMVPVESATPTDIVPQYTESETHDSEPSGAIYDTAAYHQPLEHPAKKHSGWLVVVWILILLIVGAVAGAAYFYFTTQY